MIDTWLFTALVLGILALCVILRGISAKSRDDRLAAATVAVILVSMTALTFSIAWGTFIILDLIILLSICCFAVMILKGKVPGADRS
jgi:hypothetical protein